MTKVALSRDALDEIARGRFVKVDLGGVRELGGVRARSVLVGRAGGALRAYANVCRHREVPLDFGMDTAMSDDGLGLLCHQHGALYRPEDGLCVLGPCKGERLVSVRVEAHGEQIDLDVPEAPPHA
jgi:nitrite reductase/ring-hydroxylating ferredoxin subunit